MLLWLNYKKKKKKPECVTGDALYPEKKNVKEHKTEADATPHLRLQGNASVFHLNLFSRGQNTEKQAREKHHGVTRLTPP